MIPKSFILPGVLVLAALAMATVILLGLRSPEQARDIVPSSPPVPTRSQVQHPPGDGFGSDPEPFSSSPYLPTPAGEGNEAAETAAVEEGVADQQMQPWETAINQILESDEENQQVAMRLLALAPTLPPEGQVEAVQHMVNLTDDDNYQNAAAMLLNPATSEDVAEVIYSDVLNRPNNVKLPVMVSILRAPGHRLRAETISTLQIFLGEDLGDNPEAWNSAVQNLLMREAQEEAAAAAQGSEAQ